MNSDQKLIASMSLLLIVLTIWLVYKPYIKAILFDTPSSSSNSSSSSGPSLFVHIPGVPGPGTLNPAYFFPNYLKDF